MVLLKMLFKCRKRRKSNAFLCAVKIGLSSFESFVWLGLSLIASSTLSSRFCHPSESFLLFYFFQFCLFLFKICTKHLMQCNVMVCMRVCLCVCVAVYARALIYNPFVIIFLLPIHYFPPEAIIASPFYPVDIHGQPYFPNKSSCS